MRTLKPNSFTYEEVDFATRVIATRVQGKVSAVIGVSRGGLVPSVILSHRLGLPLHVITVRTRDGNELYIPDEVKDLAKHEKVLIMDDINDSGKTFRLIREAISLYSGHHAQHNLVFAALCSRYQSSEKDVISPVFINNDDWISFPWEVPKQTVGH